MARTAVLSNDVVIPPLDHPASIHEVTVIPAATSVVEKVPTGRYAIGENVCPDCGEWDNLRFDGHEVLGFSDYTAYQVGTGWWFWYCCFSICRACDTPHVLRDSDQCNECNSCPKACECATCAGCGDKTEDACSNCSKCSGCCECSRCEYSDHPVEDVCSNCYSCESHCHCYSCNSCSAMVSEDAHCGDCGNCDCCCSCGSSSSECAPDTGEHEIEEVGWVRRGQKVSQVYINPEYPLFQSVDPAMGMAEFYLLSYMMMTHDVTHTCPDPDVVQSFLSVTDLAVQRRQELVTTLDDVFQKYVDIAIGGELRHHPALARETRLNSDRERAWGEWISIRNTIGSQALLDAAEIFRDMGNGFGGECWAQAADLMHLRVTNQIEDWVFVDRVFTMQHNNGSLLNKVSWAEQARVQINVGAMGQIGSAHAAQRVHLPTLLIVSSPEAEQLFAQWWTARNRVLVASGERPQVRPNWMSHTNMEGVFTYGDIVFWRLKEYRAWRKSRRRDEEVVFPEGTYECSRYCPSCGNSTLDLGTSGLYFTAVEYNGRSFHMWTCCYMWIHGEIVKKPLESPEFPVIEGCYKPYPSPHCPNCGISEGEFAKAGHQWKIGHVTGKIGQSYVWSCCYDIFVDEDTYEVTVGLKETQLALAE